MYYIPVVPIERYLNIDCFLFHHNINVFKARGHGNYRDFIGIKERLDSLLIYRLLLYNMFGKRIVFYAEGAL